MAWAGLASNQMVSYTDAQGGGFTLQSGQSSVTSDQCMTKTDALTKYLLDAASMSNYASNQLVPKSAWVGAAPSVVITGTYFWSYTTLSSNSGSGTITITGSSATFYARATIINGTPTVTANINIGGNTRSAVRSKTTGTTDSSALVLSPGVYSYTSSLTQAQNSGIGGGLVFTQP
jgi:hypothetical protein